MVSKILPELLLMGLLGGKMPVAKCFRFCSLPISRVSDSIFPLPLGVLSPGLNRHLEELKLVFAVVVIVVAVVVVEEEVETLLLLLLPWSTFIKGGEGLEFGW